MMNIEKLAIEHGAVHYSPPPMRAVKGLSFTFEQLEAFAKALKSSEPVACKYGNEPKSCTSSPMDCQCALDATLQSSEPFGYFKAEPFGWTDCAETDEGAIALYEHPPKQEGEPVEKYNKLLDAINLTIEENGYLADGDNCTLRHLVKAIAEAEGKEG